VRWWVVVNPSAGRGHELARRADAALEARSLDFRLAESASGPDIARLVAEGIAAGYRDYASVGGDGTAHLVLNALMAHSWKRPPTLAILPAGSGSDFIRTFALPKRLEDAADHLITADRYPTDVGVIHGEFGKRFFLNAVNVGVAAASAGRAERLPRRLGPLRYSAAFWLTLAGFPPGRVVVRAGPHEFAGDALNVTVANGQFFGGGLNVAPRASVQDGVFDIQVFRAPRTAAFAVMPRVVRGTHLSHRAVYRSVAPSASIDCLDHWPVEADGERVGSGPVRVELLSQALQFKI
jgi:YegS/Rv2252/BmrU family lipid kinase